MSVDWSMDDDDALEQIDIDDAISYYGEEELLDQMDIDTIIEKTGEDVLLDRIGEAKVMQHFGLFKKGN